MHTARLSPPYMQHDEHHRAYSRRPSTTSPRQLTGVGRPQPPSAPPTPPEPALSRTDQLVLDQCSSYSFQELTWYILHRANPQDASSSSSSNSTCVQRATPQDASSSSSSSAFVQALAGRLQASGYATLHSEHDLLAFAQALNETHVGQGLPDLWRSLSEQLIARVTHTNPGLGLGVHPPTRVTHEGSTGTGITSASSPDCPHRPEGGVMMRDLAPRPEGSVMMRDLAPRPEGSVMMGEQASMTNRPSGGGEEGRQQRQPASTTAASQAAPSGGAPRSSSSILLHMAELVSRQGAGLAGTTEQLIYHACTPRPTPRPRAAAGTTHGSSGMERTELRDQEASMHTVIQDQEASMLMQLVLRCSPGLQTRAASFLVGRA